MRAVAVAILLVMLAFTAPAACFAETAEADETAKITDIVIKGNVKVETETIRLKLATSVGGEFTPSGIRKDVENLYRMGYFDDVRVEAEGYSGGLRIIFTVVERPIIRSFAFEGNESIEASKLREKVNLTPYSIYNPSLVTENAQVIQYFYQGEGYFNATVMPVIDVVSEREVKVIFLIDEGEKVRIDDIEFEGNEYFSDRQLRKVMATKEYTFIWSWLTSTGTYKLYDMTMDIERIKGLYFNEGFIQVSLPEPEVALDEANNELDITITIKEGEQFTIREMKLNGNTVLNTEELMDVMASEEGDIVNRDQLKRDIEAMTDLYGSQGYAFATITPILEPDLESRTVSITLQVDENEKIYVNRIEITGNTKTRDNVIRRELPFWEGFKYDTSGLKASKERLKNLDFFEDIEVVPERVPDKNEVNLSVRVKEKSTGSFSIGGGYSTVDRLMAIAEIKQRNLFGRGQQLTFRAQYGKRRHDFSLSFLEPWLLGKPVSLGIELFNEERNQNIGFSERSTGGSLSLGHRFWNYWSVGGTYSYANYKYFDISDQNILANPPGTFDDQTISKLGLNLSRDSRDNYVMAHRGGRHSLYGEISAPFLASDRSFYKAVADTTWYFPFYWDTVFSLHGRAGLVFGFNGSEVPPTDLFYMGGINTVRGYDWGTIGPKVFPTVTNKLTGLPLKMEEGQVVGGNKMLLFNAEYTFPLVSEINLFGLIFFDAGNSYGHGEDLDLSTLRYSTGGGFRWISPMGLIRLEYGKILDNKDPEQTGKWEFSIGTMF